MAEEPRKRSRFDQAPSEEPPRKSRFDRRSRSPVCKNADTAATARERSPVKSVETPNKDEVKDPAAIAAAAAARITAQLQRQKGIQHVDVPPIRPVSMSIVLAQRQSEGNREALTDAPRNSQASNAAAGASKSPSASEKGAALNHEVYQQDGDFIKDIEVNDLRNRYTLTKGSTQKMVNTHLIPLILSAVRNQPRLSRLPTINSTEFVMQT